MDDAVLGALAEARALGFLGPGPLEAHVQSAQAFLAALEEVSPAERMLDLGSGGGVPGLLLAAARPMVRWTLVDRHRRRTSFLARVTAELGWVGRVDVVRGAAEELAHDPAHRGAYDAVTARSFGPPAITAEIGVAFLRVGGALVVGEPPVDAPDRWSEAAVGRLGLAPGSAVAGVATFRRVGELDAGLPRPWRQLERRPAW